MLFYRYKDSGTHVLRALDDIVVMLEDHILKAQASVVQVLLLSHCGMLLLHFIIGSLCARRPCVAARS